MSKPQGLIYTGRGRFLANVPARDMDADEVAALPIAAKDLIKSGLYAATPTAEEEPAPDVPVTIVKKG